MDGTAQSLTALKNAEMDVSPVVFTGNIQAPWTTSNRFTFKRCFLDSPQSLILGLIFVILSGNPDDDGIRKDGGSVDRTSLIKAEPRYGLF